MLSLPDDVQAHLFRVGWNLNRRVPVSDCVPAAHPAREVLANMSGLHVGSTGPGTECAASDVIFGEVEDALPEAAALGKALDQYLIGIATFHNDHGQLFMDEIGRCFGASWVHEAIWLQGATLGEALKSLLTGRKGRPVLLPGQTAVVLYGQTFAEGDRSLFDYRAQ